MAGSVLCILWALPIVLSKTDFQLTQEWKEQQSERQMLVEALDRLVRYEHYFHDINGRFTRDLSRLSLPGQLASGDLEQLRRAYEISVIEVQPKRFLLLATGVRNADRVTVDESHRLNANFVVPPPTRAYLLEEADRLLGLRAQGLVPQEGIYSQYWQITLAPEDQSWVALGVRSPVVGERREFQGERALASIFAAVSDRVKSKMVGARGLATKNAPDDSDLEMEIPKANLFKELLQPSDVQEWLENARLAQHVHKREHGRYAKRWEQLDLVSGYHFSERMKVAKNIRVHPIELNSDERDYRLVLEGTTGDLLGEQFVMDRTGTMRQVRYTEALIHQLQEGTNLLESTFHFQINPIVEESARPTQPDRP
ncbi:MAG TPA: hypothetical protein VIH99_04475 [Bdellovibrionota bacterium]